MPLATVPAWREAGCSGRDRAAPGTPPAEPPPSGALPLAQAGSGAPTAPKPGDGAISGALKTVLSSPATWLLALTYFFVYLVRQGWAAAGCWLGPAPLR